MGACDFMLFSFMHLTLTIIIVVRVSLRSVGVCSLDINSISLVLPHPVSPIIITGMSTLINNKHNTCHKKQQHAILFIIRCFAQSLSVYLGVISRQWFEDDHCHARWSGNKKKADAKRVFSCFAYVWQ